MKALSSLQLVGASLLIIALSIVSFVIYRNTVGVVPPVLFSANSTLEALWADYKSEFWEASTGRTLDKQQDSITTSEGQSYTLLRAVWLDDPKTFDKTWQWTNEQLNRPNDNLFAWRWGQLPNSSYGILVDEGGMNTASDADVDIALALVFAAVRWQNNDYLVQAKAIISDIWEQEVVSGKNGPYLVANNLEKEFDKPTVIINPSYLAPYAFRIFAKVDPEHDWNSLVDSSYELLQASSSADLDVESSAGLLPNWIEVTLKSGAIKASTSPNLATDYGYEALRAPWRIALDYQYFGDDRAKATLEQFSYLNDAWERDNALYSTYSHNGEVLIRDEVPAQYGGSIGYFKVVRPEIGEIIFKQKLQTLYDPDDLGWVETLSYYDDNWAWFGIGLYTEKLPNLAADLTDKQE